MNKMKKIALIVAISVSAFIILLIAGVQVIAIVNANPIAPSLPLIVIGEDGNVSPSTAPINQTGKIYTQTEDIIYYRLEINCSNIIFDGAGYALTGKRYSYVSGITIQANNVTIKNTNVDFYEQYGIDANGSWITLTENNIASNVALHGSYNNITKNNVRGCSISVVGNYNNIVGNTIQGGISIGIGIVSSESMSRSSYNKIIGNTMINSSVHIYADNSLAYLNNFVSAPSLVTFWFSSSFIGNVFDNGSVGNYFSQYSGVDANGDGIGDTPFTTRVRQGGEDAQYTFSYPLIQPVDIAKVLDPNPPAITIISPQNASYATSNISLTFSVNEPTSWIGYSLNGQITTTIQGNLTVTGLTDGSYSIVIYANDTVGDRSKSDTVFFTIDTSSPSPSPSQTIPEYPTWIIPSVLPITALLAITITKRKKPVAKLLSTHHSG